VCRNRAANLPSPLLLQLPFLEDVYFCSRSESGIGLWLHNLPHLRLGFGSNSDTLVELVCFTFGLLSQSCGLPLPGGDGGPPLLARCCTGQPPLSTSIKTHIPRCSPIFLFNLLLTPPSAQLHGLIMHRSRLLPGPTQDAPSSGLPQLKTWVSRLV
jgi:hypothetical protein